MGEILRPLTRTLVALLAAAALLAIGGGRLEPAAFAQTGRADERQILADLAAAPVSFVENVGQVHRSVRHIAQGPGYSFAFGQEGVRISLVKQGGLRETPAASSSLTMTLGFVGANPKADVELRGRDPGKVDYLVGDRSQWRAGLQTYRELVYKDLWPGIDMAFKGSSGKLKYEFRVRPGADPDQIRLAYRGVESLSLSSTGALQVHTPRGALQDAAPVSYQRVGGWRVAVESRFVLGRQGAHGYGFAVEGYDRTQPLVIDPGLDYSTYLGGSADDGGNAVVVHGHDAYVTGATSSPDMPMTSGAFQPTFAGTLDAFVIRLDTRKEGGAALEYGTYLGGSFPDAGLAVAVEGYDVYVTGLTTSPNFPVTANAYDRTINGPPDAFVTRIDTRRSGRAALEYSTYLGGVTIDVGLSIAIQGHDAYVTGTAVSPNFPVTPDAFQPVNAGFDGFVTRIDTDRAGSASLVYSTFLGGAGPDSGRSIAVREGDAFVAGPSASPNFPVTANAFDPTYNGGLDAVVSRIDTDKAGAAGLEYSTYLGGSGDEDTFDRPGTSIALLGNDVYVAGLTTSQDFPVTENAYDPTPNGGEDAFVTQLDTGRDGADGLAYSTYLGGSGDDIGRGVDVFGGDVYVTGGTFSMDFPVTPDAFQATNAGGRDVFVSRLDTLRGPDGLVYSTYLGGSDDEVGRGIAVLAGDAYVTGETFSLDFPVTPDAFQPANGGGQDAFLARLDTNPNWNGD